MTGFDAVARRPAPTASAAFGHRVRVRPLPAARVVDADLRTALDRARAGHEASFTRVFRAVQPGLLRYLVALVGADAEDVASEAWLQVCRDLDSFRGDMDGFRGWVATIARHRAIDHLRARGRRPADPVPVDRLHDKAAGDNTEGVALESLATSQAMAAIASLPREQAEAVLLPAVMGLDAKAAGLVLGKRAGAVRTAAHRGLRTLADRVDRDGKAENFWLSSRQCDISERSDAEEV